MLETLRHIVQEVSAAEDVQSALDVIVSRVKEAMKTEVCSVYLRDKNSDRLVFMATDGLNKQAEGRLSLAKDQGLVGLVAKREEPINLDHASDHPAYKYLPDTGEEAFESFMGSPIIHHREVLGVLVVQQSKSRKFDELEESFLVTIAAQLAGVIAAAQVTGAIQPFKHASFQKNIQFKGSAGAPGVSVATGVVIHHASDLQAVPDKSCENIEEEVDFFRDCLEQVRQDIARLQEKFVKRIAKQEAALFNVYLQMLDDSAIGDEIIKKIVEDRRCAQSALADVIMSHVRNFELMDDAYLRERAVDVKDMGLRILAYLQEAEPTKHEYDEPVILIGEELTASMLGEVPRDKLVGLVSVKGSNNSHVAILARSMNIPTVMGVEGLPIHKLNGLPLIVDGYHGHVIANASDNIRQRYLDFQEEEKLVNKGLELLRDLPCETLDKYRLPLLVNTGLMTDVMRSLEQGAEGVGLFRSEIPFLLNDGFPSEEEQRDIYRTHLEVFYPRPVTMRSLDIGGDKSLPYFPIKEENPFLGWRGIRVTLDHPEIFLVQIRAMLKANEGLGNLQILLPMISGVGELEESLELIHRAHNELLLDGLETPLPKIGVMIEVPSAVYQMRDLAKRADFFSVGSNDLTQYLLAVDRNNSRVSRLYSHYHPAVLRACYIVAQEAKKAGKPVSICGEAAGDPIAAVLFLAMGFDALSMGAANIPRVKSMIRFIEYPHAKKILNAVLSLDNTQDIEDYLHRNLHDISITPVLKPISPM
ncbi:MAG: phosphoenolpyruvate--protein phosphotransferase [Pseudomonadales bacterium]|nr:phosphoenolpyruvate--protein phosphotransferase [Pseudomonadales bacterium]